MFLFRVPFLCLPIFGFDEDVEALLNGGSLLDAPCISVATEQLVQAAVGVMAFS